MAPAEDAFVAAGKGGSGLHAEMGFDAVEGVFVAGATAAKGGFGPSADLDAGMGANDCVALLGQGGVGGEVLGTISFKALTEVAESVEVVKSIGRGAISGPRTSSRSATCAIF